MDRFRIAIVCTGNACRSPFVERYLRRFLDPARFEVTSAGTSRHEGLRSPEEMVRAAAAAGVDLSDHRSRPIAHLDLTTFDLVVGFELAHVASATVLAGAPIERTFTLPDLAASISAHPDGPRSAIRAAYEGRKASPMAEIADPIGGSPAAYEAMTRIVMPLCAKVVQALVSPL